ncbi:hypothetical protein CBR_g20311 [Chara braunii]|uniref:CBS domain-containing protein n=1 Tax=Chara braunii TaxID=69332 RepID=A0A388L048_CHABU|nr:hypothetical protein CBR_g20311 [Chara braunii]|eukprot:GBG75686.1 hypothetical protein CBR_g20311 [Chara braunii]
MPARDGKSGSWEDRNTWLDFGLAICMTAATLGEDNCDRRPESFPLRPHSVRHRPSRETVASAAAATASSSHVVGDQEGKGGRVERSGGQKGAQVGKTRRGIGPWQKDSSWRFWPKGVVFKGPLLTNRIVELGKRRQLDQVFSTLEEAKQNGKELNTIVMNAALEACIQCGDVDSAIGLYEEMIGPNGCGADTVTYGTLLKGLGEAGRLDDAFELLELMEAGNAPGQPQVTDMHLRTLMNACAEAGDILRARGVLDRHQPNTMSYNMLIKGYARSDNPLEALVLRKEMRALGLPFQRLTYNSLILACVSGGDILCAFHLLKEMKVDAYLTRNGRLLPDVITYTTLLKGVGRKGSVEELKALVDEMKTAPRVILDRVAYSAIVDAFIQVGSPKEALKIMTEMEEKAKEDPQLRPRVHVFLAVMRGFAEKGDVDQVRALQARMPRDAGGRVWPEHRAEADELLAEAALVKGQAGVARKILKTMPGLRLGINLTPRAHQVLAKLQAVSPNTMDDMFRPLIFRKEVSPDVPVEKAMISIKQLRPVPANLQVSDVATRFWKSSVIPVVDDDGKCVGAVYAEDCVEMKAILSSVMRPVPPPVQAGAPLMTAVTLLLRHQSEIAVVESPVGTLVASDATADCAQQRMIAAPPPQASAGTNGSGTAVHSAFSYPIAVQADAGKGEEGGGCATYGRKMSESKVDLSSGHLNKDTLGGNNHPSMGNPSSTTGVCLPPDHNQANETKLVGFVTRETVFDFGDRCRHLALSLVPLLSVVRTQ